MKQRKEGLHFKSYRTTTNNNGTTAPMENNNNNCCYCCCCEIPLGRHPVSCGMWQFLCQLLDENLFFCFFVLILFFLSICKFCFRSCMGESRGERVRTRPKHFHVISTFTGYNHLWFLFRSYFFFPTKVCGFLQNIHKPRIIKGPSFSRRGIMGSVFFSFKPWIIASFFV